MKKRIFAFVLFISLILTVFLTSCNSTEEASECYNYLVEAHEMCDDLLSDIYNAWHFALYEADDIHYDRVKWEFLSCLKYYNNFETQKEKNKFSFVYGAIIDETGISWPEEIKRAFSDFNFTIKIVRTIYESNIAKISELLSAANDSLKSVSKNQDMYSTLKAYYVELKSCFEFCISTGVSFEQLGDVQIDYQKNLNAYKNELEFLFN